ncbi:MAG: hypothetical protein WC133_00555 [Candidatus Omnitrophota bacterium]
MNRNVLFFIFLSVLAGLNVGSIRRSEDPVRDTQTNPILYEQKKEEEKDGKKGPLLYHVKNSPRETFFIDPPYEKAKKTVAEEIMTEKAPSSADTAGWWEEPATAPQTEAFVETVPQSLPESLPEAEQAQNPEVAAQSTSAPEAEKAPSGKGNDYWW